MIPFVLTVKPETAALLCAEMDPLNIQMDVDGGTIHLYPAGTVEVRDEAHALRAACRVATTVHWHPRRGAA